MSYLDVGREESVKGGYDEIVQRGWLGCLCGLQQRRSPLQAFGLGQSKLAYVKVAHTVRIGLESVKPISRSLCLAQQDWTRSPPPRDCEAGGSTCALF